MLDGNNMNQQSAATSSEMLSLVNGTTSDQDLTNETRYKNGLESTTPKLPREMIFTEDNFVSIIAYSCLFVIAALGNLTVFITLFRNRRIKSRVNFFIMHLSIADLIVTFVMLPLETAWHITVSWKAGDVACRILMFFRAFGFYLSSFILVTISLDRYFAILHPLSLNDADRRGRIMLGLAWICSVIASIPQSIIFHVEHHPIFKWYTQCVTFNFFPTPIHELTYNLFNIISIYGLPLIIITTSYSLILREISKKTRQSKEELQNFDAKAKVRLRRSAVGNIERARIRTLKMTLVIVTVFFVCWTPYFVISAWWWFDRDSAGKVNSKVQRGLFLFAVSNSCMDPIVYGMFTMNFKREFLRCCSCLNLRWGQSSKKSSIKAPYRSFTPKRASSNSSSSNALASFRHKDKATFNRQVNVKRPASLSSANLELPSGTSIRSTDSRHQIHLKTTDVRANINNFHSSVSIPGEIV